MLHRGSRTRWTSWRGLRLAAALALGGCAPINEPINSFLDAGPAAGETAFVWPEGGDESTFIALSFSGGGVRASAFAHGVLEVLDGTVAPDGQRLSEKVIAVSGASGGAVTAAWFGLKGRDGLAALRERFLLADGEVYLATSVMNPVNVARALDGGVNGRTSFGRFVDEALFEGARLADLEAPGRPRVWISATDLAGKAPFVFDHETFRALCSDLGALPISEAIAASSAFPMVFSPIVLEAHGPACAYEPAPWVARARNGATPELLRGQAQALMSYRDADAVRLVKLIDGAITDYYGIMGLRIAWAASGSPLGPFTPEQAVRLERGLILVADAGRQIFEDWSRGLAGPGPVDLVRLIVEGPRDTAKRLAFDALKADVARWQDELVAYRCDLPHEEVHRLRGTGGPWRCDDVSFEVGIVSFRDLDGELAQTMNRMPTRLVLAEDQIDRTIEAARIAMARNGAFGAFLRSFPAIAEVVPADAPEDLPAGTAALASGSG